MKRFQSAGDRVPLEGFPAALFSVAGPRCEKALWLLCQG